MLYREIIAVCSEIHRKHIYTLCGQNVGFFSIKPGGNYSNHRDSKGSYNTTIYQTILSFETWRRVVSYLGKIVPNESSTTMFRRHVSISLIQIYPYTRRHITYFILRVVRISGLTHSFQKDFECVSSLMGPAVHRFKTLSPFKRACFCLEPKI